MEYFSIEKNGNKIYYRELGLLLYDSIFIYSEHGKVGLQDYRFKIIVQATYDEITPAFSNHFWGRVINLWHLYNFENKKVTTQGFNNVSKYTLDYAMVSIEGEKFGFLNRNGIIVIPPMYDGGKFLGLDFFSVSKQTECGLKFGVIDRRGNLVHPYNLSASMTFTEIILYILKQRKPLRKWLRLEDYS